MITFSTIPNKALNVKYRFVRAVFEVNELNEIVFAGWEGVKTWEDAENGALPEDEISDMKPPDRWECIC